MYGLYVCTVCMYSRGWHNTLGAAVVTRVCEDENGRNKGERKKKALVLGELVFVRSTYMYTKMTPIISTVLRIG